MAAWLWILASLVLCGHCQTDLRSTLNDLDLRVFKAALEETTLTDENGLESTLMETLESMNGLAQKLTVFAPTDTALSYAPLSSDNDEKADSLKYHIIVDRTEVETDVIKTYTAGDTMNYVKESYNGAKIRFNQYKGNEILTAQGAPIDEERKDIHFTNGVIHVINGVMQPPTQNIWQYIENNEEFTTLKKAIQTAGMKEELEDTQPMTFLAPTNVAFSNVPSEELRESMRDINGLIGILHYHFLGLSLWKAGIRDDDVYTTRQTDDINFVVNYNDIYLVNSTYAKVLTTDISTTNGVIHTIDRVLKMSSTGENAASSLTSSITLLSTLLIFIITIFVRQ